MESLEIVERVGAYAGFFAVVGLAVLSALYFSQARDVRRLREWAGRAPERVVPGPAVPTPPPPAKASATGAPPARSAAGAAAAATASGATASSAKADATPAGAPAPGAKAPATATGPGRGAVPGVPAPAESGNGTGATTGGSPRPVRHIGPVVSSRTQSIPRPPAAEGSRRLAPRYVALIVAGVLILGAGIAYAVVWSSQPEVPPPVARTGPAPIAPAAVTVSVLNGTTQPGLAARVGDRVEAAGFRLGNVTNASEQQRAESVVLYMTGADREARIVGRRLRIAQIERADARDRVLAGTARVIVMVGADEVR